MDGAIMAVDANGDGDFDDGGDIAPAGTDDGNGDGLAVTDEYSLPQAPISDCRCRRAHNEESHPAGLHDVRRGADECADYERVERTQPDSEMQDGQAHRGKVHEVEQLPVRNAIGSQRGSGRQHQHDRTLDDDG